MGLGGIGMFERKILAKGLLGASMLVGASTVGTAAEASECVDSDGDGWGWDGEQTCDPNQSGNDPVVEAASAEVVEPDSAHAEDDWQQREAASAQAVEQDSAQAVDDSDNEAQSATQDLDDRSDKANEAPPVRVESAEQQVVAPKKFGPAKCVDDGDGDGWGWDGKASCELNLPCVDDDGDGWGWDGSASCRLDEQNQANGIEYIGARPFEEDQGPGSGYEAETDDPSSSDRPDPDSQVPGGFSPSDYFPGDYFPDDYTPGQTTPSGPLRATPSRWDSDCDAGNSDWRLAIDRSPQPCEYSPDGDGAGVTVYVLDGVIDTSHSAFANTTFRPMADMVSTVPKSTPADERSFDSSNEEPVVSGAALDPNNAPDSAIPAPPPDKLLWQLPGSKPSLAAQEARDCGSGHGTQVASTLASEEVGVASGVTVAPVRVTFCHENDDGSFNQSGYVNDLVQGLEYVLDNHGSGPAIVNISLGVQKSAMSSSDQSRIETVLDDLHDDGVLVVSAAGNSGTGACNSYPAAWDGGLSVGSLSAPGQIRGGFNKGPCVDIYAPTNFSVANDATGGYSTQTGTSLSAPIVSGLAAIHWANNPDHSVDEVIANLKFAAERFEDPNTDCGGSCLAAKMGPSIPEIPRRTLPARVES